MSIASEIERIQKNVSNSYAAVESMGGDLPVQQNTDNLAESIAGIPKGVPVIGKGVNLLDNWYFVDPINQRGETKYTGACYGIDRWGQGGPMTLSVEDGCIKISKTGNEVIWVSQYFENPKKLVGTTATLSILYKASTANFYIQSVEEGGIGSKNIPIPASNGWVLASTVLKNFVSETPDKRLRFGVCSFDANPGEIEIKAMKLELGETQTLARKEGDTWVLNDPPPSKALELAKCQRYQLVLGGIGTYSAAGSGVAVTQNYARIIVPLPSIFRGAPGVSYTGKWEMAISGSAPVAVTNIERSSYLQNNIFLQLTPESTLTVGDAVFLRPSNDSTAKLILDANL